MSTDKSDLPIIVESDTSNLSRKEEAPKPAHKSRLSEATFKRLTQLVILVFGIVIVGEIAFGIRTLTAPTPTVGKVQPITAGSIALTSDKHTYAPGDVAVVNVKVDTGGHTITGADVLIKYDPAVLEIKDQNIQKIGVFEDFPLMTVDNGVIKISGIESPGRQGFNGIGILAQLSFTVKNDQTTILDIDYSRGSTTDSNLIESGTSLDLLSNAVDLIINAK